MANWDKINKRFDEVLDNLTQEEWLKWRQNKDAKTALRENVLALQGQLQGLIFKIDSIEVEKQLIE